ncbi:hypothetical protein [Candidatus Enterococcus clewellii]|uniref:Uncharacterized protein n=1 Tax=Candidatus Enterococcus clewellii TaxID=1834193 RepID=A0A242K2E1_9ENTE|nr:hypothetical protein [Enterococcus sp. 9E7_DIV0242]OTP11632.1 hypothetical protein A5888_003731 [Enterococcus sp. 9E7_DIV0242]
MNIISLSETEPSPYEIAMSNGLTAVLITTFGLSATSLAQTETQKQLTVFVLEKDQSCVGRGTVGFDLSELSVEHNSNPTLTLYLDTNKRWARSNFFDNKLKFSKNL